MTNKIIILLESIKLMEDGVLAPTGEKIKVQLADGEKELDVPETIHTYKCWKSMGYQVKRGSKAVAQFPIWHYTSKKVESEEEAQKSGHCYLRTASFFKAEQVEKVAE